MFLLSLNLGLPVSRLVSLNVADIEIQKGLIQPREGQNVWVTLDQAYSFMKRYLLEGRPELNSQPEENALFISQMGSRLSRQGIWQILDHWGRTAGLEFSISPRLLQYSAADRLLKAGHSIEEIHLLLGHTNYLSTRAFIRRLQNTQEAEKETAQLALVAI